MPDPRTEAELKARLARVLEAGETVHWSGYPGDSSRPGSSMLARVVLGICAFGLVACVVGGWRAGPSADWSLLGTAGLFLAVFGAGAMRAIGGHKIGRRTLYAVSDRRALIVMLDRDPESFPLDRLDSITTIVRRGGAGDLVLRHDFVRDKDEASAFPVDRFVAIPQVRDLAGLVCRFAGREGDGAVQFGIATGAGIVTTGAAKEWRRWLERDEALLWAGAPAVSRHRGRARLTYVAAALWFAILVLPATIHEIIQPAGHGVTAERALVVTLWLIGVILLVKGRYPGFGEQAVLYAITDRRAIVAGSGRTTTIRSFFPGRLGDMRVAEARESLGDLVLRTDGVTSNDDAVPEPVGFLGLPDAREPFDILRQLRATALVRRGDLPG